ncbi:MAG TPA: carbohydrate ABC transporter permease [Spirochaetia bacterium]|nr:carbohydrate ABC transporter permease [Spirochaetia bacterium]
MSYQKRSAWRKRFTPINILIVFFTIFFVVYFVFPFYWQLTTSLRTPANLTAIPPQLFPNPLYFTRYIHIFAETAFPLNVRNSLITSSATTITCLAFSVLSSYSIARLKVPGHRAILIGVLVVSMLPAVAIVGPLYLSFRRLSLINTLPGLIIAYTAFFLPFTMWFLTSFFKTIPPDLEEAATIDGCTPLQALFRIIIPLSAPAVFTIAMLVFIFSWNEFLFAFTFTTSDSIRTYPVGLIMFRGLWNVPWGDLSAASTVVTVPIVIIVLAAQRYVIQGLTAGAVKG